MFFHQQIDKEETYSFDVDWWSLGVIAFELLYRYRPFEGEDAQIRKAIAYKNPFKYFIRSTTEKDFVNMV